MESYVDFTLAEDEELNAESLNALKTALDDLKIVDVKRKPQGLSDNLKAGEDFLNNREALQDLIGKGFAVTARRTVVSAEILVQRRRSDRHDEERRRVRAAFRQPHQRRQSGEAG